MLTIELLRTDYWKELAISIEDLLPFRPFRRKIQKLYNVSHLWALNGQAGTVRPRDYFDPIMVLMAIYCSIKHMVLVSCPQSQLVSDRL